LRQERQRISQSKQGTHGKITALLINPHPTPGRMKHLVDGLASKLQNRAKELPKNLSLSVSLLQQIRMIFREVSDLSVACQFD
jgi:hypothetical protein